MTIRNLTSRCRSPFIVIVPPAEQASLDGGLGLNAVRGVDIGLGQGGSDAQPAAGSWPWPWPPWPGRAIYWSE
jgi:hypothetical protein